MGVHCVAHKANLVIQSLGNLTFIMQIKNFMMNMYNYFSHNPKKHLKFHKLVQNLDTNLGIRFLKMLKHGGCQCWNL